MTERKDIDRKLLLLMAVSAGIVVANLYYIQPLLGEAADFFGVSTGRIGIIATLTQLGYAAGLFLILPSADLYSVKKLVVSILVLCVCSLVGMYLSGWFFLTALLCFCVGFTSVVPQLLLPVATRLSLPENAGKNIGTVMSGLLIGILGARVLSGLVGKWLGWRSIYLIAAVGIVILDVILYRALPELPPGAQMKYLKSLHSMLHLPKKYPIIGQAALNGGIAFGLFSMFWVTLTLHLSRPPFGFDPGVIGLFGLFGITGALLAPVAGRMSDRKGTDFTILFHMIVMALSMLVFGLFGKTVWGIVVGILLLDYGVQCCNVANQARIQTISNTERNRIASIFMVSMFLGGSIGSILGTSVYTRFGWLGFVAVGGGFLLLSIVLHLLQCWGRRNT